MSHDAQRPEGGSAPPSYGPQMYSFDGRPVDPPVPPVAPVPPPEPFRSPFDSTDREPRDPDAPPADAMPPARWVLSVVGLLFSLVFGAVALYFSWQVGVRWQRGDAGGSQKASQLALIWSMVAVGIGLAGLLIMGSAAA